MAMTRQQAWELLVQYNTEPFHLRHAVTVEQVMGLPTLDGKPTGADLATSVTISITPFQQLLLRAGGYGER